MTQVDDSDSSDIPPPPPQRPNPPSRSLSSKKTTNRPLTKPNTSPPRASGSSLRPSTSQQPGVPPPPLGENATVVRQPDQINGVAPRNLAPGLGKGSIYEPRIYGFRVSEIAKTGPRMKWLRERPEDVNELDECAIWAQNQAAMMDDAAVAPAEAGLGDSEMAYGNEEIDEAIKRLDKAVALAPGNQWYRLRAAELYLRKEDFKVSVMENASEQEHLAAFTLT